jgi:purine-cytosine permease-like protein
MDRRHLLKSMTCSFAFLPAGILSDPARVGGLLESAHAMLADYLLSGKKWAGPREGINFAGYIAWAVGFVIGINKFLPISADLKPYLQPAAVYSFIAGFILYLVLAKAGLQPKSVDLKKA